jgi:surface polysaccharide O-acyltransferase-like enzyme
MSKARLQNIDIFRVFALASVVILHTYQPSPNVPDVGHVLTSLLRAAVPFFFLTSGYFLGQAAPRTWPAIQKISVRIFTLIVFWVALYLIINGHFKSFLDPKILILDVISGGDGFHLWFLAALWVSSVGVLICRHFGRYPLILIGACLFVFGLSFGPYLQTLGLNPLPYPYHIEFKTRWGPFEGFLFVAVGYVIGSNDFRVSKRGAWGLVALGAVLQLFEMGWIYQAGGAFGPHDYLAGTVPLGLGAFFLCLNMKVDGPLEAISMLGPSTLGAYCLHLAVLQGLRYFLPFETGLITIPMAGIVFAASLGISYYLSKVKFTRRLFA